MTTTDANLDPDEFFGFLDNHDDYPVSGQTLAQAAREEDAEPELVEFFDALPTVNDESEVVKHAVDPKESPLGKTLDLKPKDTFQDSLETEPPTTVTLEIADIVEGD